MTEMQCVWFVDCAMLLYLPHTVKIQRPTPHQGKQITQLVSTIFHYVLISFNTKISLYISGTRGCRF